MNYKNGKTCGNLLLIDKMMFVLMGAGVYWKKSRMIRNAFAIRYIVLTLYWVVFLRSQSVTFYDEIAAGLFLK